MDDCPANSPARGQDRPLNLKAFHSDSPPYVNFPVSRDPLDSPRVSKLMRPTCLPTNTSESTGGGGEAQGERTAPVRKPAFSTVRFLKNVRANSKDIEKSKGCDNRFEPEEDCGWKQSSPHSSTLEATTADSSTKTAVKS